MKKIIFAALFLVFVSVFFCSISFAIDATVTMPYPTGVTPVTTLVMRDGKDADDWEDAVDTLDFDPLTLNTFPDPDDPKNPFQIFLPDHFFCIDLGYDYTTEGDKITGIKINYNDTSTNKLGKKATATFIKKKYKVEENVKTDLVLGGKLLLDSVKNKTIDVSALGGGWLRAYVGLVNKDPDADVLDPTAGEPFVPGDAPGAYEGTITISSY